MSVRFPVLLLTAALMLGGCTALRDLDENIRDVGRQIGEALGLCCEAEKRVEGPPVRQQWQGPFRIVDLALLPERGDQPGTGLIADPATWAQIWRAFRPAEMLPAIDFSTEFVAFARNRETVGVVSLVHVAVGGNSMDLRWKTAPGGPAVPAAATRTGPQHIRIAFAVLKRGAFGVVRSQGHALVLPPAAKRDPAKRNPAKRDPAARKRHGSAATAVLPTLTNIERPDIHSTPPRKAR